MFGPLSVTYQMKTKSQAHQLQWEQESILKDISQWGQVVEHAET